MVEVVVEVVVVVEVLRVASNPVVGIVVARRLVEVVVGSRLVQLDDEVASMSLTDVIHRPPRQR